jgi:hypothetical protein
MYNRYNFRFIGANFRLFENLVLPLESIKYLISLSFVTRQFFFRT